MHKPDIQRYCKSCSGLITFRHIEILGYMKILEVTLGEFLCPHCGAKFGRQSLEQVVAYFNSKLIQRD